MDLSSLVLAVAVLCSLPAGVVLIGVLVHRPTTGTWLQSHARALAWLAAVGWGAISLSHWFAPGRYSLFRAVVSVVAMLCMTGFALLLPSCKSARSLRRPAASQGIGADRPPLGGLPGAPAAGRPVRGSIRRAAAGRGLVHSRAAGSSMPYPLGGMNGVNPCPDNPRPNAPRKECWSLFTSCLTGDFDSSSTTLGLRRTV